MPYRLNRRDENGSNEDHRNGSELRVPQRDEALIAREYPRHVVYCERRYGKQPAGNECRMGQPSADWRVDSVVVIGRKVDGGKLSVDKRLRPFLLPTE